MAHLSQLRLSVALHMAAKTKRITAKVYEVALQVMTFNRSTRNSFSLMTLLYRPHYSSTMQSVSDDDVR